MLKMIVVPVALAAAFLLAFQPQPVAAADSWPQCVVPKGLGGKTPKPVKVAIYAAADGKTQSGTLNQYLALRAVARKGEFIRLTGSADSAPIPDEKEVGWAREREFEYQALRNCN
ncbi:MAG TPA: hypothetical protein VHL79_14020 [Ramlibacter sp.]|jgi:hypothetical protein|nr:hypothetical protein [Ramlibacter sp.]